MAAAEATIIISKTFVRQFCSPDLYSLAMSGLPKEVAGQKGGIARHSRREDQAIALFQLIRAHDCTSCVTGLPANATFNMNFGYIPKLSVGDMPQSSLSVSIMGWLHAPVVSWCHH